VGAEHAIGYCAMDKRLGEGQLSLRDYVQILWVRRWSQATAQLRFPTQASSSVLQANSSSASAPNAVDVPTDGHE
jgi:hypothetical protein